MSLMPNPVELMLIAALALAWVEAGLPVEPESMQRIAIWPFHSR